MFATLQEAYQPFWERLCCCDVGRRFNVTFRDPSCAPIAINGGLMDFVMLREGVEIGTVSRKYFSVSDSYGLHTEPNQDDELLLAVAIT
jgi:uncharacterized protein YxjI